MTDSALAIAGVRNSVCAIMRIVRKAGGGGKKKPAEPQFGVAFVGTAWCISEGHLLTAHHILNVGKPRKEGDRFYAFTVPDNGEQAYAFPVTGFPLEDPRNDFAILEIGLSATAGQEITPVAVSLARPPDGSPVVTYGFPAPEIKGATLDPQGNFLGGGKFFLKGHANEGIVAAQYDIGGGWVFEFNVAWHHGESGGPVFQLDLLAGFAVMQHYRNIQSPHGVVAGPRRGRSLDVLRSDLAAHGAKLLG